MGRSVSRPLNAQVVAYAHVTSSYYCRVCNEQADAHDECDGCKSEGRVPDIQFDDDLTHMNWDDDMVNLSAALQRAFPSLRKADRWLGREDHVVLENNLAAVTVSEYCGLVAVCLVPERRDAYETRDDDPLSVQWIASAEARFRKIVAETFGIELAKLGTMSNGEGVFKRVEARA